LANPLTDWINKTLQPVRNAPAEQSEAVGGAGNRGAENKEKPTHKHPSDPTAPYDRRAADWLIKAQASIKAGQWKPAFDLLQKVTDLQEDSLYKGETGAWVSIRAEADRLRGQAPAELLEEYRVQFGGLARQLLAEAQRTGDLSAFGRVAKGYFHTEAGYDAANRLGSLHLDRAEYALAARWFAALWQAQAPVTREASWRAKAAFAVGASGQAELGAQISANSNSAAVELGGQRQDPGKWLQAARPAVAPLETARADWPMFYGNARRTAVAAGGEPLLLPRWRLPISDSEPVRAQIEQLLEDLADAGTQPMPLLFPVLVNGMVAVRTLHGVQVLDAQTGKPRWTSEELQTIERLLANSNGQQNAYAQQMGFFGGGMVVMGGPGMFWNNGAFGYQPGQGEYTPLAHLLFRNANFGLLSSDGQQLYLVEDHQFLSTRQAGNPWWDGGMMTISNAGTRLRSYDLRNGRPLWEVGGTANGEELDPPLAGCFFFGAPVVDGNELFIVGENTTGDRTGQIRLYCLDPRSGVELWSQLIAYCDSNIDKDVGRRWFTAQVAIDNGVVVCPTTVGWLVAVDRFTHGLLWGYRAPRPAPGAAPGVFIGPGGAEGGQVVPQYPLSGVWSPAPPVVTGGRIVYTPTDPQSQALVCLDQFTGKEVWQKQRGTNLYLAGVFDKTVLVVGREGSQAFKIENGEPLWQVKHPAPVGRGVASADRYYLPLTGGEVWSLNLQTGEIVDRAYVPEQVASLGNLALYQGMLVSVDAQGVTAFEQREAVTAEIARRKAQDPRDSWAAIREAEIAALYRKFDQALPQLLAVDAAALPAELKEKHRVLLVSALSSVIRSNFSAPEVADHFQRLGRTVSTPEERLAFRRLEAEWHVARQEFARAFDAYLKLAEERVDRLLPRDEAPATSARSDVWVAGKLADLWHKAQGADRKLLEQSIGKLPRSTPEEQLKFLSLFGWHDFADEVRGRLAKDLASRGELGRAEQLYLRLAQSTAPAVAAEATLQLARLLEEAGLTADAWVHYGRLETRFGDVPVSSGKLAREVVAERRAAAAPKPVEPVFEWNGTAVRVERMGAVYQNWVPQEIENAGARLPFFERYRMDLEPQAQRLEVVDSRDEAVYWSLPLRTAQGFGEGGFATAIGSGHRLTMYHQGVLHTISPAERKTLWSRPVDGRFAANVYYGRNQNPLVPMQPLGGSGNRAISVVQQNAGPATLCVANNEVVCYLGRRSLTALDAGTGQVRWTYAGIRQGTTIAGGEAVIYVRPADGKSALALRAIDGKPLELPRLKENLGRALRVLDDDLLLSVVNQGTVALRRYNPLTDADRWKVELPKGALAATIAGNRMVFVDPPAKEAAASKVQLLDLETGDLVLMATLPADSLKSQSELFVLADSGRLYLLSNKGRSQTFYSEQMPFVRASGTVLAVDLAERKLAWQQQVTGQNLLLERLDYSPLLIFVSRKYEQKKGMGFWSMHLVVLDKRTGAKLIDEKSASQPGFRSLTLNAAEKYVELRGWNERVRLYPAEKSADAEAAGGG
jgi:outer membrane protein assembly factor BamB